MESEIKSLGIHLKVSNFDKSREFYDSLGFKPVFAYGPDDYLKSLPKGINTAPEKYRGIEYRVGRRPHRYFKERSFPREIGLC